MNIYQKLLEVRKSVPYLKKESDGHQYKYTGSSQVLASVRGKMDELGLVLVCKVTGHNLIEGKTAKGGKELFTELDLEFTWINAEKPEETIVCPWYGQGVDSGEKGVGKALTYAEKYFILKQFNIATDKDDPDSFQKKAEGYSRPDPITSEQVGLIKTKALEFAEIRKKTDKDVYDALKITKIESLNTLQANAAIETLDGWLANAKKKGA